MVEKYSLLPDNHFGARPRRSAEQALNVLVERIYQAWRGGKILSLVSFDVKGAFNGVYTKEESRSRWSNGSETSFRIDMLK
jgi:hypothetical protein